MNYKGMYNANNDSLDANNDITDNQPFSFQLVALMLIILLSPNMLLFQHWRNHGMFPGPFLQEIKFTVVFNVSRRNSMIAHVTHLDIQMAFVRCLTFSPQYHLHHPNLWLLFIKSSWQKVLKQAMAELSHTQNSL